MDNPYQLFIHKYQPTHIIDFNFDNETMDILNTLISIDNLNILLIGDIATGKTSLLNAMIREYYKGYDSKDYEENILYINNLKEQGINYYRTDVKTFCQTRSNIKNKKKFVILDDIDFINEQSQQVFRNYIDKFSLNVNFLASCSNTQKVIESIQSRFFILKLKTIQKNNLMKLIHKIQINESIEMENGVDDFIVGLSNYTVKTVINYMEKFKLLGNKITLDLAIQLCSNISFLKLEEYTHFVVNKDLHKAIKIIYDIYDNGYSVMDILDNYFIFVKITDELTEEQKYKIIPYICKYITIFHNIHEDEIELALFTNNLLQIL
jgi:DNA polymerase III delta prime subunit